MRKKIPVRLTIVLLLFLLLCGQPALAARAQDPIETPTETPTPEPTATATPEPATAWFYLPMLISPKPCNNQIAYQPPSDEAVEWDTLAQINTLRADLAGKPPLLLNENLTQIARFHSADMATMGQNPWHEGSAGDTWQVRFTWLCESFGYKNEIIGWGFSGNTAKMMEWWMNSKVHHDIILDANSRGYTHAGPGFIYDPASYWKTYWTVNFGSNPVPKPAPRLLRCITEMVSSPEGGVSATYCE